MRYVVEASSIAVHRRQLRRRPRRRRRQFALSLAALVHRVSLAVVERLHHHHHHHHPGGQAGIGQAHSLSGAEAQLDCAQCTFPHRQGQSVCFALVS